MASKISTPRMEVTIHSKVEVKEGTAVTTNVLRDRDSKIQEPNRSNIHLNSADMVRL